MTPEQLKEFCDAVEQLRGYHSGTFWDNETLRGSNKYVRDFLPAVRALLDTPKVQPLCRMYEDDKKNAAYEAGRDCGERGANAANCRIDFFATRELTDAWELGVKHGCPMKSLPGTNEVE